MPRSCSAWDGAGALGGSRRSMATHNLLLSQVFLTPPSASSPPSRRASASLTAAWTGPGRREAHDASSALERPPHSRRHRASEVASRVGDGPAWRTGSGARARSPSRVAQTVSKEAI
jgi:hypothetical protein